MLHSTMQKSKSNKNCTIEFYRFIFAMLIVLCHAAQKLDPEQFHLFSRASIGVEYFFVVSGFLLAASIDKMPPLKANTLGNETKNFLLKKIRSFCPEYYIAWGFAFIFYLYANNLLYFKGIMQTLADCIWELLFVSQSGLFPMRVNGVVWYISTMLLAMAILYPLLRKYKEFFFQIGALLISIFIFGYMFKTFGNLRTPTKWLSFTFKGNIRGFAEICLGISLYPISLKLGKLSLSKLSRFVIFIFEHFGYLGLIFCSLQRDITEYDFIVLFFAALSIMLSFSRQSLFHNIYNNSFSLWLRQFSFSLYLSHVFYANSLSKLLPTWSYSKLLILYLFLSFSTGLVVMYVSKLLQKLWPKLKSYILKLVFVCE